MIVLEFKLEEIKGMNLYEKMSHVEKEIGVVPKNLEIKAGKSSYKAVSEADVKHAVSPLEHKYRIKSIPMDIEIVESGVITSKRSYGDVEELWLRVKSTVTFINIDNPEEKLTVSAYGDGIDNGDKAPGKGDTYSVKYCYLKAYKIVTGEDPDTEASGGISTSSPKPKQEFKKPQSGTTPTAKTTTAKPAQTTTAKQTTSTDPISKPQEKLLNMLVGKDKVSKQVEIKSLSKTQASALISKANKAKDGECYTLVGNNVELEDSPF